MKSTTKLTSEEMAKRCKKLNMEMLGDYVNIRTPVRVRCLRCNQEWDADPRNISKGYRYSTCKAAERAKTLRLSVKGFVRSKLEQAGLL